MKDERIKINVGIACLVLFAVLAAGCTSSDADAQNGQPTHAQPPAGSLVETVERSDGRPTAVVLTDGRRVPIENGEATVDGTMVFVRSDGQVEYHRTPSVIMAELGRTQVAYLIEGTGLTGGTGVLVYFEGLEGNPRVDPASGALCWMAVTCKKKDCPGGHASQGAPNVFSFREPGYSVDDAGNVVRPNSRAARRGPATTDPCPHCGSRDFLEPYRPAEIVERRAQLEAELAASRAARR